MDHCDVCGKKVPIAELDEYFRCPTCYANWESSQEDNCNADSGPLSLDEQLENARDLKEGRWS